MGKGNEGLPRCQAVAGAMIVLFVILYFASLAAVVLLCRWAVEKMEGRK